MASVPYAFSLPSHSPVKKIDFAEFSQEIRDAVVEAIEERILELSGGSLLVNCDAVLDRSGLVSMLAEDLANFLNPMQVLHISLQEEPPE